MEPHDQQIYYVNIDLLHQYGISVAESQTFLRAKRPQQRRESILSLSCWNIHGLTDRLRFGNKLTNEEFINHINKHDIVILTESWMKDDRSNAAQKTYKKKTGRLSGGFSPRIQELFTKWHFIQLNHRIIISDVN